MLDADRVSPLEGALEGLTNILAVGDNMDAHLETLNCFEEGCDLAALGSLGWAHDCSMIRDPLVGTETPTRSRTCCGSSTSTVRGDNGHIFIE